MRGCAPGRAAAATDSPCRALPDEPLWLDADAARVAQMLANLLSNAAKYTPAGGGASR